jgi:cobalamin biosynthesis protein CobD/CbiB
MCFWASRALLRLKSPAPWTRWSVIKRTLIPFGWCGARLDDFMNFVPARLTLVAAWSVFDSEGLENRASPAFVLPAETGWSEATMAGVLSRN